MGNRDEVFAKFRPFCAALASSPSKRNLDGVKNLVKHTDKGVLEELQDYILFPHQVYLKDPSGPENYTLAVVEFVDCFASKIAVSSKFAFTDLTNSLMAISLPADERKKSAVSEDMKKAFLAAMAALVDNSVVEVKLVLLEEMKPQLNHLVLHILEWIEHDEVMEVVRASLRLLRSLIETRKNVRLAGIFSARFGEMLPGATSKLAKFVRRNLAGRGPKLKAEALDLWTDLVTGTFCDDIVIRPPANVDASDAITDANYSPLANNARLAGLAQDNLMQHLQVFASLAHNHDASIRKSLQRICANLLSDCAETLRKTFPVQVEILSLLSVDTDESISAESSQTLTNLLTSIDGKLEFKQDPWLVEMAHEKVFENSRKLRDAAYLQSAVYESSNLRKNLVVLHANLNLLKKIEMASIFFYSETYVTSLLEGLISVSRLEKTRLVEESIFAGKTNCDFLFDSEVFLQSARPSKQFVFLKQQGMVDRVLEIIYLIASYGKLDIIVGHLTSIGGLAIANTNAGASEASIANRFPTRETIFIVNNVVAGLCNRPTPDRERILKELAELYLDFAPDLATHNGDIITPVSVKSVPCEIENNDGAEWKVRALLIEGLSCITKAASKCGISHFERNYVGQILSQSLKHADVQQSHQAHVLFFSLLDIAQACGYPDIRALLSNHRDYLSRHFTLELRRSFSQCSSAGRKRPPRGLTTLLRVILEFSDDEKQFAEAMRTLLRLLDTSWMSADRDLTTEMLRIVAIFVENLAKNETVVLGKPKRRLADERQLEKGRLTRLVKGLKYADELLHKETHDDIDEEESKVGPENNDEHNEDIEEEIEKSVSTSLLESSIEHCRHFISMVACPQWQILSMEISSNALLGLQRDEKTLLPLVHLTWAPLKLLFTSDNVFVVDKAFHVLRVMAHCARSFVHRRTIQDVFPHLSNHLRKLQAMVEDRGLQQTMAARQSRRLLRELTRDLWDFLDLLELDEFESDPIIDHMIQFVRFSRENFDITYKHVDEAGNASECSFFKPVRQVDADILWLKTR